MNIARPIKCSISIIAIFVSIYVLLYIPNSIFGGYWGPVFGRAKWASAVPASTLFLWQPYFGYSDGHKKSFLGCVYLPLILIDQNYIHHPYDLMITNDSDFIFSNQNHIRWNPKAEDAARRDYIKKAIWRSRCVDDSAFCLESSATVLSKKNEHFIVLLIYDEYGTNAVSKLQLLSDKEQSEFAKENVLKIIHEVQNIEKCPSSPLTQDGNALKVPAFTNDKTP